MNMKRVTPVSGVTIPHPNGGMIVKPIVVDVDDKYFAARIAAGDLKLATKAKKKEATKDG